MPDQSMRWQRNNSRRMAGGRVPLYSPSTVRVPAVAGCALTVRSLFSSAILEDLAMRGFAISFLKLARVALSGSFLFFLGILLRRAPTMTSRPKQNSLI